MDCARPEEADFRRRWTRYGRSNRLSPRDAHSGWKIGGTFALDEQNNGSFVNCYGVGVAKFQKIIRRPKKIYASKKRFRVTERDAEAFSDALIAPRIGLTDSAPTTGLKLRSIS